MMCQFASETDAMRHALALAERGVGSVEPNPPVGAVIVDAERRLLGEGWHQQFGGPHAEVFALEQAGAAARGATLFCTLEPCCHFGKTPPCTQAIIRAGIARVIAAAGDPSPHVAGGGIHELEAAGIQVDVGLLADDAQRLLAPFFKLTATGRPWVHAKWAMTCDGKIASRTGQSKWITGEPARAIVHQLRGRMDAIIVGIGTVLADDPLLTARPHGPRTATRIVLDHQARLPLASRLVKTVREAPVLCAAADDAPPERIAALRSAGVDVLKLPAPADRRAAWDALVQELGRRRLTHVLIEGGSAVLGSAFDSQIVDEWHVFVAPKLVGGAGANSPIAGDGRDVVSPMPDLVDVTWQVVGDDVYLHGRSRGE
jgi:diaminohydroxyphosphoribosylaminopyrimidine deaminase/5-amino-6-(5-phosphoribosylamino)uracil reductase